MDNSNEISNFRSAELLDSTGITQIKAGGGETYIRGDAILRTPQTGNLHTLEPPPLPPTHFVQNQVFNGPSPFGSNIYNAPSIYNPYNSGYNSFGSYGGPGMGAGYNTYNRFGGLDNSNPLDPTARFIQLAESTSRPAFQSIESLVSTVSHIAAMLDSTFYALTSSFRAVLGMAANLTQLRSVFAQIWRTFAIFRGLDWIYKKILHWLRISNLDPSTAAFKQAYAEAVTGRSDEEQSNKVSPWPVLAFLSFIITAPYLIMRLFATVSKTAQEEAQNPAKWINPLKATAQFDFKARSPYELSMRAGDSLLIAPKDIQISLGLINTSWALATINGQKSGLVPTNYLRPAK